MARSGKSAHVKLAIQSRVECCRSAEPARGRYRPSASDPCRFCPLTRCDRSDNIQPRSASPQKRKTYGFQHITFGHMSVRKVMPRAGKSNSKVRSTGTKRPRKAAVPRKVATKSQPSKPDYNIAAVERALDLLEALSRTGPAPLAALADAARCTRTAAFRLLRTLQARGFALQDEARGVWRLGARWGVLGRASHDQGALAASASSHLAELGQAVGENVYLGTRDALLAETIATYQAEPTLRLYSQAGTRGPLHAGPARLLLAYAPEAIQTQVLAQRLPRFTPATRTDPTWIAADLQRIRSRGYLITADEVYPGAVSASAPVRDAAGQVIAVITVSGPSMRMRPPRPKSLLPQLLDCARRLSVALGWKPPEPAAEPHGKSGETPIRSRPTAPVPALPR